MVGVYGQTYGVGDDEFNKSNEIVHTNGCIYYDRGGDKHVVVDLVNRNVQVAGSFFVEGQDIECMSVVYEV